MIHKYGFDYSFCIENENNKCDVKDKDVKMNEDISNNNNEKTDRINVKTSLPDIPMIVMESLEIVQNYIFTKATCNKMNEMLTSSTVTTATTDRDDDSED